MPLVSLLGTPQEYVNAIKVHYGSLRGLSQMLSSRGLSSTQATQIQSVLHYKFAVRPLMLTNCHLQCVFVCVCIRNGCITQVGCILCWIWWK